MAGLTEAERAAAVKKLGYPDALTQREIAAAWGVSAQSIVNWTKAGCPRNSDGMYSLREVIAWKLESLVETLRKEDDAADRETIRYRKARADREEEMVKQMRLRETALDNLINTALQLHEARRLGLGVSDEELRDRIQSLPYFQRDGSFSKEKYLRLLQMNRLTPGDFERQQRDEMVVEAFQNFVRDTVKVSEQELWNNYVLEKEQVRLEALVVSPASFEQAVDVEEEGLREYFGRNSEGFLTPEKVKVAYVLFAPGPYRDQVKV